jgi:hypothetical protein
MLKNKLKDLVERNNLAGQGNFEIIQDSQAADIFGGGTCTKLTSCGTFTGACPNLTSCTSYTAPD